MQTLGAFRSDPVREATQNPRYTPGLKHAGGLPILLPYASREMSIQRKSTVHTYSQIHCFPIHSTSVVYHHNQSSYYTMYFWKKKKIIINHHSSYFFFIIYYYLLYYIINQQRNTNTILRIWRLWEYHAHDHRSTGVAVRALSNVRRAP